jgi:hypothetical protein
MIGRGICAYQNFSTRLQLRLPQSERAKRAGSAVEAILLIQVPTCTDSRRAHGTAKALSSRGRNCLRGWTVLLSPMGDSHRPVLLELLGASISERAAGCLSLPCIPFLGRGELGGEGISGGAEKG